MTYVFYETGNNDILFKRISEAYAKYFMEYFVRILYKEFIEPESNRITDSSKRKIKRVFAKHGDILNALNCRLFPNKIYTDCMDTRCKEKRTVKLAPDQLEILEFLMGKGKTDLISDKKKFRDRRLRSNIQLVLEDLIPASIQTVKPVPIACGGVSAKKYKKENLGEYMRSYFEGAKETDKKAEKRNFVYVSDAIDSHYDDFHTDITSPDVTVTPCERFQKV